MSICIYLYLFLVSWLFLLFAKVFCLVSSAAIRRSISFCLLHFLFIFMLSLPSSSCASFFWTACLWNIANIHMHVYHRHCCCRRREFVSHFSLPLCFFFLSRSLFSVRSVFLSTRKYIGGTKWRQWQCFWVKTTHTEPIVKTRFFFLYER